MLTGPTAECCNSWKVTGKLFTVYYLTQLLLIHAAITAKDLSALSLLHHSFSAIWLWFTTKTFTANCSFLPFFPPPSSPIPSCSFHILICIMVFHSVLFVSPWLLSSPRLSGLLSFFKVDPNAFPGSCKHALPVSLRHKSNIWNKTNKYTRKYPLEKGLSDYCV